MPLRYSAKVDPANNDVTSTGWVSTRDSRLCSSRSNNVRRRNGRVRRASVTGAPRASGSGATIASSMCWTMCTLKTLSS